MRVEIIRRHLLDGVGAHRPEIWDDIMDPGFVMHFGSDGAGLESRAAYVSILRAYWVAFPDLHIELLRVVDGGEVVAAHYVERGTHTGPFFGTPPTGRAYAKNGLGMYCVRDDRMVEAWIQEDDLAFTRQLGLALPAT